MDADNHMNDWGQGIEMDWDAVEKLVNEAYKKGAEAEREACVHIVLAGTGEPVQTSTLEILRKERERLANEIRERKQP